MHLDLYLTAYRSIPTIGWLFLLQVITAFALAAAMLVISSRVASAAGAGFALSTLGDVSGWASAWAGGCAEGLLAAPRGCELCA